MSKKEMLINVSEGEECRIALVEDGRLEELYLERSSSTSHVGNIYKGKVTNVEPSIQAAFVDFGIGRNGFLHISDLMPEYFGRAGRDMQERVGKKIARRDRPPIQHCLRRGDEILVQIIKEGIGTKGPTLSSYLSIPGRMLVMMPGVGQMGVSKKIEDEDERRRLRKILASLEPPKEVGFIIRTNGVGKTKAEIERDFKYLKRLWENIERKRKSSKGPTELYAEGDLVTRTVRDVYSGDVDRILVDEPRTRDKIDEFFKLLMPRTKNTVELWDKQTPLFHAFGIEEEIERMFSRHVPLPSGGSLVIDQTEAIVAIDVNSGKYRDNKDAETTAFKIDMEAADEICRQLRLRDIGGIVICDFIDLRYARHRAQLFDRLTENFKRDKAKSRHLEMNEFGIVSITRQRMRPSLKKNVFSECNHCAGSGHVKTAESVSLDVMRKLAIAAQHARVMRIEVACHADAASFILNRKRRQLTTLEADSGKQVLITTDGNLAVDDVQVTLYDDREGLVFIEELGVVPEDREDDRGGRGRRRRRGRGRDRDDRRDPMEAEIEQTRELIDETAGDEIEGESDGQGTPYRTADRQVVEAEAGERSDSRSATGDDQRDDRRDDRGGRGRSRPGRAPAAKGYDLQEPDTFARAADEEALEDEGGPAGLDESFDASQPAQSQGFEGGGGGGAREGGEEGEGGKRRRRRRRRGRGRGRGRGPGEGQPDGQAEGQPDAQDRDERDEQSRDERVPQHQAARPGEANDDELLDEPQPAELPSPEEQLARRDEESGGRRRRRRGRRGRGTGRQDQGPGRGPNQGSNRGRQQQGPARRGEANGNVAVPEPAEEDDQAWEQLDKSVNGNVRRPHEPLHPLALPEDEVERIIESTLAGDADERLDRVNDDLAAVADPAASLHDPLDDDDSDAVDDAEAQDEAPEPEPAKKPKRAKKAVKKTAKTAKRIEPEDDAEDDADVDADTDADEAPAAKPKRTAKKAAKKVVKKTAKKAVKKTAKKTSRTAKTGASEGGEGEGGEGRPEPKKARVAASAVSTGSADKHLSDDEVRESPSSNYRDDLDELPEGYFD